MNLPTQGSIFVNENNLKAIHLSHYRSHLGMSLIDEAPFEGTLRENLTFGNPHRTAAQIKEVLEGRDCNNLLSLNP